MPLRFTVLASGSGGNASLVEADGFGVLIDAGLGPRQLASRLAAVGAVLVGQVHAVLLTHTHCDHWKDRTLAHLRRRGFRFYCHADHHRSLRRYSSHLRRAAGAGPGAALRGQESRLAAGLRCRPLPLRHDGGATFGFRLEGAATCSASRGAGLCRRPGLLDAGAGPVAWPTWTCWLVEFNHDVAWSTPAAGRRAHRPRPGRRRPPVQRPGRGPVCGSLALSERGRLRHLVQLHLSRDCNRPELALRAVQEIVESHSPFLTIHT